MNKPTSLKALAAYLDDHPFVRFTDVRGKTSHEEFLTAGKGRLWFQATALRDDGERAEPAHFLPVDCHLTDAASQAESGITFDDSGFSFTKFGVTVRFDYCEENPNATP